VRRANRARDHEVKQRLLQQARKWILDSIEGKSADQIRSTFLGQQGIVDMAAEPRPVASQHIHSRPNLLSPTHASR
jgi:hypothetical protein